MTRPPASAIGAATAAAALVGLAVVGAVAGVSDRWVFTAAGLALVAAAIGTVFWAAALDHADAEEERLQHGPHRPGRRRLLGLGIGAAALTAGGLSVPAARRVADSSDRLRTTAWRAGVRIVDADGVPIVAARVTDGELATVYPEGSVGAVDSQAVLVREPPGRFAPDPERPDWIADGIVVYSKLCTHMACPLGLYQQTSGTLLCPCHQAVFDVLDGGRAISGPARRALPQLPVAIDDAGHLVALGDFSDAVGTGFWSRP
jgi:ubiquinol-cytochrome c reductase iron-sulfur subunit